MSLGLSDESQTVRPHSDVILSQLVAVTGDAVILTDANLKIQLFNPGAEQIFGWNSAEIIDQSLNVVIPQKGHDLGESKSCVENLLDFSTRKRRVDQEIVQGIHKSGEKLSLEVTISRLRGEFAPMFGAIIRDVTRRERIKSVMSRLMEMKSAMIKILAHDLRSPLTSINLNCDVLMNTEQLTREGTAVLKNIRELSREISHQMSNLLTSASRDIGEELRASERFNLKELVLEVVRDHKAQLGKKNQQLKVDLDPSVPVEADRHYIKHAISNYLSNAIKYSLPNRMIEIHLHVIESHCVLTMLDEGPGLTEEDLANVFIKFRPLSAKPTGEEASHGLGLFIVKYLIEAHGGMVRASNRTDKVGSLFEFSLPCIKML